MAYKKTYLLLGCLLWVGTSSLGQGKKAKLAQVMQTYHRFNMFDGAVLVAENGKLLYKGAFGMANREWNIPNTTDTKFMIGSVSKPITSLLMLLQVQKGLVSLDKTIADYLPEFAGKPAAGITIRQLLGHTSGMPNYDIIKDFFPRISRQQFSRKDYLKVYMDSALAFAPGSRFYYSSWGYFTLGHIMERVTGKSYAALMKQDIFDKLDMHGSGSYHHMQVVPKRATGYDYSLGGYTSGDFRDQSNTMGTGDLYSTVEDLFKLHLAIGSHRLLNKELTDAMLTPGMRPNRYGFGWFNQNFRYTDTDSVTANYHLGMTDGFISFMLRIPATNSMAVILCNGSPTDFFGIIKNLLRVLYNKPIVLKQPVHKAMETLIGQKGPAGAVAAYPTMKADTAHYYIDWISMNFITEQLHALKRYEEARILGELNAAEFPNRDLVMATLANVYLELGRKADAIRYYQKTLAITPGYEEAKNRLKELEGR
jgi:CubicO group peptidase (beta-lactamase class C family)